MKDLIKTSIPLMEAFLLERAGILSDGESEASESYSPPYSDTLTPGVKSRPMEHDSAGLVTRSQDSATIPFEAFMDNPSLMGKFEGFIEKHSGKVR